ncbi:MAG TPA: hypothetical protein VHM20_01615 [Gammaproteobacteria bacterium]|jgi:hypothetical protein|nr:hypothetical protein [Gammaproteobacteria bacterium]
MKATTFVSMVLAGLLATSVGFAADANGNVGADTPADATADSSVNSNTTNSSDPGEMGITEGDTQQPNNDYTADTATEDED